MRQKAIGILRQVQDKLADRITGLVVENEFELLDDADLDLGLCNNIYELAEKLRVVSQILQNLPGDSQPGEPLVVGPEPVTFEQFIQQLQLGENAEAVRILSVLFQISSLQADRATARFLEHVNPLVQLAKLRTASHNDSLEIIRELFGITGMEAVYAAAILNPPQAA